VKSSPFVFPLEELTALTPLDGRYRPKLEELASFISEHALIKTRIEIEVKYLFALSDVGVVRPLLKKERDLLEHLIVDFSLGDSREVKKLEKITRHDVKAMERILREKLKETTLEDITEMIHFGITSDDINNLSYRLLLYRATQSVIIPSLEKVVKDLSSKATAHKALPMLARTHGQPAVPTTLGKELVIFGSRLSQQIKLLKNFKLTGKFNGAVGNFNALQLTYPEIKWIQFSKRFVSSLGLIPNLITTQINTYDDISEYFHFLVRINTILISLDQDMWRYISDGWFVQEVKKGEVGSSTMPQKVNPIDFENSEGNLGLANAMLEYMARKLAVSRLQRDLSDSTTIRNTGTVLAYSLIGYQSTLTGLSRVRPHEEQIHAALYNDWAILTEGVQTILRKAGVDDPYSVITSLSRGNHISKEEWVAWIEALAIGEEERTSLLSLSPDMYVGLAVELTEIAIKDIQHKIT